MGKFITILAFVGLAYGGYLLIGSVSKETPKLGMDGYAGNLKRAEDKAHDVMHQDNTANAANAVERFKGEKGHLPASLQEVVDAGYLERVPQGVSYDPSTGACIATP